MENYPLVGAGFPGPGARNQPLANSEYARFELFSGVLLSFSEKIPIIT
jgi:hypothetical protein